MKRFYSGLAFAAALGLGASVYAASHADIALEYPSNYKTEFTNYFTGDRQNGHQIISLYANDIAVNGARSDGKVPIGSVIVGELTPAVKDADGEALESSLGHLISSGEVTTIVMMKRIAGNDDRYPDELKVGDWEFEVFSPAGENLGKDTTACRECHHGHEDTEFMYSLEHLAMKVVE